MRLCRQSVYTAGSGRPVVTRIRGAASSRIPEAIDCEEGSKVGRSLSGSKTVAAIVVVSMLTGAAPVAGQTAAAPPYTPPRTANGQPDLQGIWQVLNTAAWDIQDHNATLGVPAGRGVVEGNELPYHPAALEKKKQNYAGRATLDPDTKCLLSGVPRITYMPHPFQIVQQADKVNILYEYNHTLRHIYMNGNQ